MLHETVSNLRCNIVPHNNQENEHKFLVLTINQRNVGLNSRESWMYAWLL